MVTYMWRKSQEKEGGIFSLSDWSLIDNPGTKGRGEFGANQVNCGLVELELLEVDSWPGAMYQACLLYTSPSPRDL